MEKIVKNLREIPTTHWLVAGGGAFLCGVGLVAALAVAITWATRSPSHQAGQQVAHQETAPASLRNKPTTAKSPAPKQPTTAAKSVSGLTAEQKATVAAALKSLEKIEAAVETGVNHLRYSTLVADAKALVNEADRQLPDGEPRASLMSAMMCYADANTVWNSKIQYSVGILNEGEDAELIKRYHLPTHNLREGINTQVADELPAMQRMWAVGHLALEEVRRLSPTK